LSIQTDEAATKKQHASQKDNASLGSNSSSSSKPNGAEEGLCATAKHQLAGDSAN